MMPFFKYGGNDDKELTESKRALRVLAGAMATGLLCLPLYAVQSKSDFFAIVGVGVLLAGASSLFGGTLGFLFGIPRTLQQEGLGSNISLMPLSAGTPHQQTEYRANTNLEQISDWLTKILVGVGLTQMGQIRDGMALLTTFAADGLGGKTHEVFAFSLLSYSLILGFLFGYLWTRLFFAGALREADQAVIGALVAKVQKVTEKAETTERKLDALKKQSELDAAALNLAYRQLNSSPDLPTVPQAELEAALAAASRPVKVQIFNQAWQTRSESWRDAKDKPKMERTIPLFEVLIRDDVDGKYHKNHGQLGFALKDKIVPEWLNAERELSKAIEIRGSWEEEGWLLYEFNRALCRIMLDPAFGEKRPSNEERREMILHDLKAAAHLGEFRKIFRADSTFKSWMALNGVSDKDLKAG